MRDQNPAQDTSVKGFLVRAFVEKWTGGIEREGDLPLENVTA
jgi:hypothetical protein